MVRQLPKKFFVISSSTTFLNFAGKESIGFNPAQAQAVDELINGSTRHDVFSTL